MWNEQYYKIFVFHELTDWPENAMLSTLEQSIERANKVTKLLLKEGITGKIEIYYIDGMYKKKVLEIKC